MTHMRMHVKFVHRNMFSVVFTSISTKLTSFENSSGVDSKYAVNLVQSLAVQPLDAQDGREASPTRHSW